MKPCALYRHWDAEGRLLYVGISLNAIGRLSEHSLQAKWYPLIESVTIEHFPSIDEARAAEKLAIIHERPKHNVRHIKDRLSHTFYVEGFEPVTVQDIL